MRWKIYYDIERLPFRVQNHSGTSSLLVHLFVKDTSRDNIDFKSKSSGYLK